MLGPDEALFSREMLVERLNFISIEALSAPLHVRAKTRYRHAAQPATLYPAGENCIRVIFDEPQRAITPGQAAVFTKMMLWSAAGQLRPLPDKRSAFFNQDNGKSPSAISCRRGSIAV